MPKSLLEEFPTADGIIELEGGGIGRESVNEGYEQIRR